MVFFWDIKVRVRVRVRISILDRLKQQNTIQRMKYNMEITHTMDHQLRSI
jgi:hypothetical protein